MEWEKKCESKGDEQRVLTYLLDTFQFKYGYAATLVDLRGQVALGRVFKRPEFSEYIVLCFAYRSFLYLYAYNREFLRNTLNRETLNTIR